MTVLFCISFLCFENYIFFFFNDPAPTKIYPLPLPDPLPIYESRLRVVPGDRIRAFDAAGRTVNLTIVGVLEQALQFTSGVFVDQSVVRGVFPPEERYTA